MRSLSIIQNRALAQEVRFVSSKGVITYFLSMQMKLDKGITDVQVLSLLSLKKSRDTCSLDESWWFQIEL